MTDWRAIVADAVRRLRRNGLAGGAAALLILAAAPPTAGAHGFSGPLAWGLLLAFCLLLSCGLVTIRWLIQRSTQD